jgi:hypothetical protein
VKIKWISVRCETGHSSEPFYLFLKIVQINIFLENTNIVHIYIPVLR